MNHGQYVSSPAQGWRVAERGRAVRLREAATRSVGDAADGRRCAMSAGRPTHHSRTSGHRLRVPRRQRQERTRSQQVITALTGLFPLSADRPISSLHFLLAVGPAVGAASPVRAPTGARRRRRRCNIGGDVPESRARRCVAAPLAHRIVAAVARPQSPAAAATEITKTAGGYRSTAGSSARSPSRRRRTGPAIAASTSPAPPGTPVRAAGAGTVTFAGDVAGALHVVVTHRNGLRTSYSFLADVSVAVGDAVTTSTVLGHAGGADPDSGHGPDTFHFGLRVGERYVDPLLLYQTRDLTELVRLVPVAPIGPDGSWEHANIDEPTALELGVGHQLVPPEPDDDGCCGRRPARRRRDRRGVRRRRLDRRADRGRAARRASSALSATPDARARPSPPDSGPSSHALLDTVAPPTARLRR